MKKDFSNDDFTKLFLYMEKRFDAVDEKFTDMRAELNQIKQVLDQSADDYKTLVEENAARAHATRRIDDALDNHETRIEQLEGVGLKEQTA